MNPFPSRSKTRNASRISARKRQATGYCTILAAFTVTDLWYISSFCGYLRISLTQICSIDKEHMLGTVSSTLQSFLFLTFSFALICGFLVSLWQGWQVCYKILMAHLSRTLSFYFSVLVLYASKSLKGQVLIAAEEYIWFKDKTSTVDKPLWSFPPTFVCVLSFPA